MKYKNECELAFEFGKSAASGGIQSAPCYDIRMHRLVSESRTKAGTNRNLAIMGAWNDGYTTQRENKAGA